MNYHIIPEKKLCTRCDHVQSKERKHCDMCGASFEVGVPDIEPKIYRIMNHEFFKKTES